MGRVFSKLFKWETPKTLTFLKAKGDIYKNLAEIIEVRFGLLDELCNSGVIKGQQIEKIRAVATISDRVFYLLNELIEMSEEQQQQFLSALDKTQQSHVTNYIRNKGQQPASGADNWPVYGGSQWERINRNWDQLIGSIDTQNGLLNDLVHVKCINSYQKGSLSDHGTRTERNQELLYTIRRRGTEDFKKFIDCLIKTKQHFVVSLLEPNCQLNSKPISEPQASKLEACWLYLVECMNLKHEGIFDQLLSAECITKRQKAFIESAPTACDSNDRLLEILKLGSASDFDKFIACLNEAGQTHISDVLSVDGVVAGMDAKTNMDNADEDKIAKRFFYGFQRTCPKRQEELLSHLMVLRDNRIVAMKTSESIKVFILCSSLRGLEHLVQLFATDQLSGLFQKVFNFLFDDDEGGQLVIVTKLEWNFSDHCRCVQHLSLSCKLHMYSQIHQLALQSSAPLLMSNFTAQQSINDFPHELVEILLMKAACQLFKIIKKTTTRADGYAIATLCAVCKYWLESLTDVKESRRMRRQLAPYYAYVCDPYGFTPKRDTSLTIENGDILGSAELNNKLYVMAFGESVIQVYEIVYSTYRKRHEDIKLPDLCWAVDIVACSTCYCLYISDGKGCCIWHVDVSSEESCNESEESTRMFVKTDYKPYRLSVLQGRLLVTAYDGRDAYMYDIDGKDNKVGRLIKHIKMPEHVWAHHAVETLDGTVIVCHNANRFCSALPKSATKLSELTVDGNIKRHYTGGIDVNDAVYLVLGAKNHILVCNLTEKQVFHFNSNLECVQILMGKDDLSGQPYQMCYNKDTRLLYICYFGRPSSSTLHVFKL